ncbi:MAG TPA: MarR family transcriptional regulator [Spirochaetota bacterium]
MADPKHVILVVSSIKSKATAFLETELAACGAKGLVASHGAILGILFRNDGTLKMKEIAEQINRDKSTVTHLVTMLIKSGYVRKEKTGTDARETYVTLTPKGWEIEESIHAISKRLISKAYRGFSEDDKKHLMTLLQKMRDNFA